VTQNVQAKVYASSKDLKFEIEFLKIRQKLETKFLPKNVFWNEDSSSPLGYHCPTDLSG